MLWPNSTGVPPAPPPPPSAPPPPPPPPPPAAGFPPAPSPGSSSSGRGALLSSITGFSKNSLKKSLTNDRSGPKL